MIPTYQTITFLSEQQANKKFSKNIIIRHFDVIFQKHRLYNLI